MTERVERLKTLMDVATPLPDWRGKDGQGWILGCGCCGIAKEDDFALAYAAVDALPALMRLYDAAKQVLATPHKVAEFEPSYESLCAMREALRELEREGE